MGAVKTKGNSKLLRSENHSRGERRGGAGKGKEEEEKEDEERTEVNEEMFM